MDDGAILDLYLARLESAITETDNKYGSYCLTIALNVLKNRQDAEECVNDTYHKVWKAIPPEHPTNLKTYLCKITRNLSLDKYEAINTKKRGRNFSLISQELQESLLADDNIEATYDSLEIGKAINVFLRCCEKENRIIFVRRYWYGDSVNEIARRFGISKSKVKSALFRTRKKLRVYLESEGIAL